MRRLRIASIGEELDELTSDGELERGAMAESVGGALRSGICPNERAFDRFLPFELRRVSAQYWTPLSVALRVAKWLEHVGAKTVVDIGSGAGKFCVATALAGKCSFTGIEHRPRLVEAAHQLAQTFGVDDRVRFLPSALDEGVLPRADAYYLFNPFGENLLGREEHLDGHVELSDGRFHRDVALTEVAFNLAAVGTYVIKYNGFGGQMPPGYDEVLVDRDLPNVLRMWRKNRAGL